MKLVTEYRTLGRTGLAVAPLALGAMTFGWGADKATARQLFDRYRDAGGNLVDTADVYTGTQSEEWLGEFVRDAGCRDELVLATKFSFSAQPGNPNAGGNGRKNVLRALEGSLRRLRTDHVDVYILHAHDLVTPVEEVMATFDALVRAGKVRYLGLSNVPAWYASRAQAMAELRGWERIATLQLEYSLVARNLEREHVPLARETGMGLMAWSPLAGGFLTGKYRRENGRLVGQGRVVEVQTSGNPVLLRHAGREQSWAVVAALARVAARLGRTPAEVATAWVLARPQVSTVLVGATRPEQLDASLAALQLRLPEESIRELDTASAPEPTELDNFFGPTLQAAIHGGIAVVPMPRG